MKTRLTIIALGALIMLAGCSRSETVPGPATIRLSARLESAGTRATVNGNTGEFAWEAGDQIAIHLSSGYADATLTPDGTTPLYGTAELTVSDGTVTRNGYALFPAAVKDAAADGVGSTPLKVTLPASYSIAADLQSASAPLPMIAVNDPDSDILHFHHVGGLMRITCSTIPAGTKNVTVTLDKGIVGSFTVTAPETATPTIAPIGSGTSVVFTVSDDAAGIVAAASNVVLNLPVPCGTYESLTVDVTPSNASFPVVISGSMAIGRAEGLKVKVTPAP